MADEFYQVLPVEIRYLDTALAIGSGTELRRWTLRVFCPSQGLAIEDLREKLRALLYITEDLPPGELDTLHKKVSRPLL